MTHRERVLAAINHQEPDRVPIDLGSTRCTSIHVAGYQGLKAGLGIEAPDIITDRMMQPVLVDERILRALDIDTRGVFPGAPDKTPDVELDPITYRDEWGVVRNKPAGSYWYDLVGSVMAGEITVQDILKHAWPDPEDPGRIRGVRERALKIKEEGEYALVLSLSLGTVHISQYLRGFTDWFMDMAADQKLIGSLMDAITDVTMTMSKRMMAEVGDLADIVMTGDDLGTQGGPQVHPETYRKVIKPRHARFFRQVKEMCPQAKIFLHTCGSVYPLLPDLIDIGVDILNPVQVAARDMDPVRLKAEFGDKLTFWGAIDTQHVLPKGSPEDVKAEVATRIAQLGQGGGYVLCGVHNLQPDVPTENILTMYRHAREVGVY